MTGLLPIPGLPPIPLQSPALVRVLDRIRYALNDDDEYAEFFWFAREYPRVYRYHLNHATARLRAIHQRYIRLHARFSERLKNESSDMVEIAEANQYVSKIYWDFEAYLSAISSGLDVLARILGTAYSSQTPPSFNKFCSKNELSGVADLLRRAREQWVIRMKDYRDCFVHYTPVDYLNFVLCRRYRDGWQMSCRLPVNPNVRDMQGFRFSRRVELLKYALTVFRHMRALDRKVGTMIWREYRAGRYPLRVNHLFFVGSRHR